VARAEQPSARKSQATKRGWTAGTGKGRKRTGIKPGLHSAANHAAPGPVWAPSRAACDEMSAPWSLGERGENGAQLECISSGFNRHTVAP
jgi:hypothetical protein